MHGNDADIPIVFTNSGDPMGAGLVVSLAHPGGNATGLSSLNYELAGKRLELFDRRRPASSGSPFCGPTRLSGM